MDQHIFSVIAIVVLIGLAIYRRIRRNVGWQPLNVHRLWIRTIIFLIIGLLFLFGGIKHPITIFSDLIGIIIGLGLAYYGSKHTQYEVRGDKWYFQPNTWIGSLVTVIFLGRLVYRFYKMYDMGLFTGGMNSAQTNPNTYSQMGFNSGSSWAAGLYLIMFAYYTLYFILVIRKEKKLRLNDAH